MAQYKVPQDVEADDKLLGPFTFRQLIYLFVAGGLVALAFGLYQLLPPLVIIPIPFAIFFLILALPIKKDQPMETYLAALISFYLKPNKRFWNPGQRESTITITAPKKIEGPRIRAMSEDEASHRLSFLADVIDSEGRSVTGSWNGAVKDEYLAEASSTPDMFENYDSRNLNSRIKNETDSRHEEAVKQMRDAIKKVENISDEPKQPPKIIAHSYSSPSGSSTFTATTPSPTPPKIQPLPKTPPQETDTLPPSPIIQPIPQAQLEQEKKDTATNPAKLAAMQELASNQDYTVATIAKEARRIKESNDNEVYISLH